jgi:hypothetical protein
VSDHSLTSQTGDPFGWLKTLALVVILFAAMLLSAMSLARAEDCAPGCRARHNDCRVQTKGAATQCDSQLQACIHRCLAVRSVPTTPATVNTLVAPRKN